MPEITQTLRVEGRAEWRAWLAAHHRTAADVWLVSPRRHTGRARLPYNDAVEEALCFGWIDSTQKSLDDDHTAQRFSPRRPGVPFSQPNRERMRRMMERGRVMPEVRAAAAAMLDEPFEIPADVAAALRADAGAWAHFQRFSPAYRRIRAAYVDHARDRPDEFARRLANLVEKTRRGVQFGYGIESYY